MYKGSPVPPSGIRNRQAKPIIPVTLAYILGLLLGNGFLYVPHSVAILVFCGILICCFFILYDKLTILRAAFFIVPSLLQQA